MKAKNAGIVALLMVPIFVGCTTNEANESSALARVHRSEDDSMQTINAAGLGRALLFYDTYSRAEGNNRYIFADDLKGAISSLNPKIRKSVISESDMAIREERFRYYHVSYTDHKVDAHSAYVEFCFSKGPGFFASVRVTMEKETDKWVVVDVRIFSIT